jgi:carbamate kinase
VSRGSGGVPRTSRVGVLAFGGNALVPEDESGTYDQQQKRAAPMAEVVADLVAEGYRVAVVHGNGPHVGSLAVQQEGGADMVPPQPLQVLVAMTQGQIGHLLTVAMREAGLDAVAVLTHVVVDQESPAFQDPTKPIGPFFDEREAHELADARGWAISEDSGRGYRRVVASPPPVDIVEHSTICELVDAGQVVVAVGGGGIPVTREADGTLRGVEAVIDKDLAAERLATLLGAQALALVTNVAEVALDYGKPDQRAITEMTATEARAHLDAGQFPPGSMGPKVTAAIEFIQHGGEVAVITNAEHVTAALRGAHGTRVVAG